MADTTDQLVRADTAVHAAIARFEQDIADGELTFTKGEFADEPDGSCPDGGWLHDLAASHLCAMDFSGGAR